MPRTRTTINLAPGDLRKEGAIYDLPIALGILVATGQLACDRLGDYLIAGELSLSGATRPIKGGLAMAVLARESRRKAILLPPVAAQEAALVEGLQVYEITSLDQANRFLAGQLKLTPLAAPRSSTPPVRGEHESDFADIKGQPVNLVELSVSHYLLARGLESVGLKESDVKVVNTSDADIVAAYATPAVTATVTWKPLLSEVTAGKDSSLVFDSSKTPGEILDLMVVNSAVLKANPKLGKALVGAWYETMALMLAKDAKATAALESMAKASGTDLAGFKGQLATTFLYSTPAAALAAAKSPDLVKKMDLVRKFSFDHGLLGEGAKTVDAVGIEFPGGVTLGNKANLKLRFDPTYMQLAADGKL